MFESPISMLDDDLYKLTMCQAVCEKYPHASAKYTFINRGDHKFSQPFADALREIIQGISSLKLGLWEIEFLHKNCPFLTPVFIDFLSGYRYNPDEVAISYYNGKLLLSIEGPWYRTILWEVKLMAMISELYFEIYGKTDISLSRAVDLAGQKAKRMREEGIKFADFGTRRRYSRDHHDAIAAELHYSGAEAFVGSSNLAIARAYGIKPIGTQAHEWFMFHGAKYGYKEANRIALRQWVDVYHGDLGIALSDTFTSDVFLKSFTSKYSKLFDGVRHDSGDPFDFGEKVIKHYDSMHIDPKSKTIVFSDGLNIEQTIKIYERFHERIKCSFGIGTNLTNDISGIVPLNMVIKMSECKPYGESDWLPVVKLSDSVGKHTGSHEEVELCKRSLRIS